MSEYTFPPLEEVKERLRLSDVWSDPKFPRWKTPENLLATEDMVAVFDTQPNMYNPDSWPIAWGFRPDPELSHQDLIDAISKLPTETMYVPPSDYGSMPKPEVWSHIAAPDRCYFLKPDREDAIIQKKTVIGVTRRDPWEYRERAITPYPDGHTFKIEAAHADWEWTLYREPHTQGSEWIVTGLVNNNFVTHPEGQAHPGTLEYFGHFHIRSENIYGRALIGLKQLGFFGALDAAINYIIYIEEGYDVSGTAPKVEPKSEVESEFVVSVYPVEDGFRFMVQDADGTIMADAATSYTSESEAKVAGDKKAAEVDKFSKMI